MSKFDLISRGTLVCDPASILSSSRWPATAGLGVVSTGFPTGLGLPTAALALQSLGKTNTSFIEAVFNPRNLGVDNTTFRGVLVEVFNPNSVPTTFRFEFASGGTRRLYSNLTCDVSPNWQLLWAPALHTGPAFITPATDAANNIDRIRPQFLLSAQDQEFNHAAGQNLYIGRVWVNPVQVPVFLINTDDGFDSNIVPTAGRSAQSIIEARGFKYTAYVAVSKIGTAGFMTWDQCRSLRDSGHCIGHHSYAHPQPVAPMVGNYGLRLLGPFGFNLPTWTTPYPQYPGSRNDDTAIYEDFMMAAEKLIQEGLPECAFHHALPQGEWDQYVRTALIRAGAKSVRAYNPYNRGFPIRGAQDCGGGHSNSAAWPTGWTELTGSVQLDGTTTETQVLQYVSECERVGATGTAYTHSNTGFDKLEALCDRLKTDQAAGLIRVMTVAEYYEQGIDWGGRCKFDGSMPDLSITSAIGSVDQVQVWDGTVSVEEIKNILATD